MSAECHRCGLDIVYPVGTWPIGECPSCSRYPKTPVDCLISELRDEYLMHGALTRGAFELRIAQFKQEVSVDSAPAEDGGNNPIGETSSDAKP